MKGFKNVMMILMVMGIFFIHLKYGTVLKVKSISTSKYYVTGYTMDTLKEDFGRAGAKRIIVPREQIVYIEEEDE